MTEEAPQGRPPPADGDRCRGLDPDWLAHRLAAADVGGRGVGPTAMAFDGFIGTGQMSRNARFGLTWDEDAIGAARAGPSSIVVKVPSANPTTRAASADGGIYQRECYFYTDVRPLVDVRVPVPLVVDASDDGTDFAIVLEDLRHSSAGDHLAGLDPGQLDLAIGQAAALHAPRWDDVAGAVLDPVRPDPVARLQRTQLFFETMLPACLDRLGPRLDDGVIDFLERFVPRVSGWMSAPRTSTTVVHGDFRPDNFLFGNGPDAPPLAVVDWQTISMTAGATDVSYLLGGTLPAEERQRVEGHRLEQYRAELSSRGVDYDRTACFDDYALGSAHGISIAIGATIMADETERGDALFALMLNRHTRHAMDVDLLGRLDRIDPVR